MHVVPQVEGGEQGDAMMPLLFCLGQQGALQAVRQLEDGERLFAFLDVFYVVTRPERVGEVYRFSCIRIHNGKTKIWNKSGTRPEACDRLERIARVENPRATGRWVAHRPTRHQGVGHSTGARRPVTSKESRETNKPIGERSAVRVVVVMALRSSKSQLPA